MQKVIFIKLENLFSEIYELFKMQNIELINIIEEHRLLRDRLYKNLYYSLHFYFT